jgi:hypothetical protein
MELEEEWDLELELELFLLTSKVVKNIGGDTDHGDPCPEHRHVAPQLLQSHGLVRLPHKHPRKHVAFSLSRSGKPQSLEFSKVKP